MHVTSLEMQLKEHATMLEELRKQNDDKLKTHTVMLGELHKKNEKWSLI